MSGRLLTLSEYFPNFVFFPNFVYGLERLREKGVRKSRDHGIKSKV
jgi:hypothetical protein